MWIYKFFVFCLYLIISTSADDEITLDIRQGKLKGLKATTITNGKPYFSFKGIPYAQPNVGSNKFRAPEPPEPWQGVLDATKHGSTCVFYCHIREGLFGDEDCLFLNVYTPTIDKNARRAVIVFFHRGAFNSGSGDDDLFGPDFLIDDDVILVTMNYRLGALGFLSTNDVNAPGNVGLKDQVMALRWVKENIKNFGGCPNRVTIAGISVGSSSVHYHLLSPMSKGLFKNAIMQSGTALGDYAISHNGMEMSFKLGEYLGIKTNDSAELVKKLTEFSAQQIVDATTEINKKMNLLNGRMSAFVPVVEPQAGQEIFLPNDPWEMMKSGSFADVPLIIGMTSDEMLFMTKEMLPKANEINKHLELFVPDSLNITDDGKLKEISEAIRKFYFDGKAFTSSSVAEFVKLTSDIYFTYGIGFTIKMMGTKNKQPIYEYLFTYNTSAGFVKNLFKIEEPGVSHGDELAFEFHSKYFNNKPEPNSPAEKMTKTFTKLWTNFAKNRNPTNKLDDDIIVKWEPTGPEGNYMNINLPLKMEKGLYKDRLSFWVNIYRDILGEHAKLFQ
ncbi:juvenile hormone esterase-like [Leptopilina boulardi]|uniref:juvenile hormone esterase-like n=1 Tax=Leptopilina boulardi TaxID=63433 RepID=UPI0021F592BC|nr:juvenile hormone esterase-like [Leptopilina boulardi]